MGCMGVGGLQPLCPHVGSTPAHTHTFKTSRRAGGILYKLASYLCCGHLFIPVSNWWHYIRSNTNLWRLSWRTALLEQGYNMVLLSHSHMVSSSAFVLMPCFHLHIEALVQQSSILAPLHEMDKLVTIVGDFVYHWNGYAKQADGDGCQCHPL